MQSGSKENARDVVTLARKRMKEVGTAVAPRVEQAKQMARDMSQKRMSATRDRPLMSLAVVFLLGFSIGVAIVSGRRK